MPALDQLVDDRAPLGQHRVVDGGPEEPVPVLGPSAPRRQPVADVGHHAVQVDGGVRGLGRSHPAHASGEPLAAKP